MKFFILFIINFIMVYSEPISKFKLRGMFNDEKNKFIENSVNLISDSIISEVITNAKSNINHTMFDFACNLQSIDKMNEYIIKSTKLYLLINSNLTHNDYQIKYYTQQITQEYNQKCYPNNNIHYPDYLLNQDILAYDEGGINVMIKYKYPELTNYYTLLKLYNIQNDLIINLIMNRLNNTFHDIEYKYINNDLDCCNYYLISY
jgi:hypothetical protein